MYSSPTWTFSYLLSRVLANYGHFAWNFDCRGTGGVQLVRRLSQVIAGHDVVAVEDRPRLVAAELHGHRLGYAGARQVPNRAAPEVVQEHVRNDLGTPRRLSSLLVREPDLQECPQPAATPVTDPLAVPMEYVRDDRAELALARLSIGPLFEERGLKLVGEGKLPALLVLCGAGFEPHGARGVVHLPRSHRQQL
jgi:hypothetical protein